nr:hypothetical protein [Tanacetum cinerariifolium]
MKTRIMDTELPQTSVPAQVVADEAVYEEMYDSVKKAGTTATGLDAEHDRGSGPRRQETMRDAAAQTRVLNLETTKTTQAKEISSLKRRAKRLEKKKKSKIHGLKRLYKVGLSVRVESSVEEKSLDEKDASKQERNIADIDADAETTLVDETAEDQGRYNDQEMFDTGDDVQAMMDADYELAASILQNLEQKRREEKKTSNQSSKEESNMCLSEKYEGGEIRAEENSKRAEEYLQQESTKKQKVDDDQEAAELKRCLEIVPDDKDDVTIDATPLSSKSPTIIDYKIHKEGRKSYFQIIRADGSS